MKICRKNLLKCRNGITLIALVVTIIVLLILAGISISMLSGDNGILQKATDAKTNTDNEQIKERVQLAYTAAIADGQGILTEQNLRAELINEFGDDYDLDEDITTNEWVISVSEIERLRVDKGFSAPVVTSNLTDEEKTALKTNGIEEMPVDSITNANLKENHRIKAVITGEVPITTEMTYITGTKDTGVVVAIGKTETDSGNEFVWIPVPEAICEDINTLLAIGVKDLAMYPDTKTPMAKLQSGSTENYEGLLYEFTGTRSIYKSNYNLTTTSHREPTTCSYDTDTQKPYESEISYLGTIGLTENQFSTKIQSDFNKMVSSVKKYGGFYIARYELGIEGTTPVSKPASVTVITADANNSNTASWYGLYSKTNSMYQEVESLNIVSQMIWGSQYDAVLNWIVKTGNTTSIASNDSRINTGTSTGGKAEDIINNIYDLYGCHIEFTQEAVQSDKRVSRGGRKYSEVELEARSGNNPTETFMNSNISSRSTIYIKE